MHTASMGRGPLSLIMLAWIPQWWWWWMVTLTMSKQTQLQRTHAWSAAGWKILVSIGRIFPPSSTSPPRQSFRHVTEQKTEISTASISNLFITCGMPQTFTHSEDITEKCIPVSFKRICWTQSFWFNLNLKPFKCKNSILMMTMEEKCVRPADGFGFGHQRDWFNYATTPAPVYPTAFFN